jgi:polyhydroxyalkanoate synthesis repressor PhaR
MGELRTVRKYSNRRLYDPAEGRYVTLAELCARVVEGAELRVIDADTKEDITCSVLFQMMAAQEKRLDPSMSRDFLLQAIRSRAETPCRVVATYLEQSLNLLTILQADQKRLRSSEVDKNPVPTALRLAEANYQRWCSVQSQIYQAVANVEPGDLAADGQQANTIAPSFFRRSDRRSRRSPRQLGVRVQR